ncbi:MAG: hypothetical protein AAF637_04060 [Pseudomonadota bacterium]
MKVPWKSAGLFVLVSGTTSLLGMLGSVTYGDVVRYHDWVDPASVARAQLGQYYIIEEDGSVDDPLCELRPEDFDPAPQLTSLPGRSYVNHLGQLTPIVVQLVGVIVPMPQNVNAAGTQSMSPVLTFKQVQRQAATAAELRRLTERVLQERNIAVLEKNGHEEAAEDARRLSNCRIEIMESLSSGLTVCQVDEIVRDESTGVSIGVGFATRCLVPETAELPRHAPELRRGSFLSQLKHTMDLIDIGRPT